MPLQLFQRLGDAMDALPRKVQKEIDNSHGQGMVAAADIQAVALASRMAMHQAGLISIDQAMWTTIAPVGEARYQLIGDQLAAAAATRVARMVV